MQKDGWASLLGLVLALFAIGEAAFAFTDMTGFEKAAWFILFAIYLEVLSIRGKRND